MASSSASAAEKVSEAQGTAKDAERRRQAAERKLSDVTASLKKAQVRQRSNCVHGSWLVGGWVGGQMSGSAGGTVGGWVGS